MMALQEGSQVVTHGSKQTVVLWIRSVDYALATPLLLIDLGLLAGAGGDELILLVVSDVLMIVTGYYASVSASTAAKWGLFFLSMIFFIPVLYTIVIGLTSHKEIAENPRGALRPSANCCAPGRV